VRQFMITLQDIEKHNPCQNGLDYIRSCSSLLEAWNKCERSDWLWWVVCKILHPTKEQSITYAQVCTEHVKQLNYAASASDAASDAASAAYVAAYVAASDAANANAYAYAYAYADADVNAYAYAYAYAYADAYRAERKWQCKQIRKIITFNG
jgi:hypothetical protein